jgi:hypothetical protein
MLLSAIRETAAAGGSGTTAFKALGGLPKALANLPGIGQEAQEVEMLLQRMKASAGISSPTPEERGGGGRHHGRPQADSEALQRMEQESRRLRRPT